MALILAVVGALLVAAGVGLIFLPAGLIVGGLEAIAAGYVIAYLRGPHATARPPR